MPYIQEVQTAFGFKKQSALQTPLTAADMWTLSQTNQDVMLPEMTYESNKDDMGKGTPFATQLFPLTARSGGSWNARLSSENAAMAGVFGIGLTSKTAAGSGWKYTCSVGTTFAALETDMPTTTVVQACRQGANDVFDFALVGMALEEFSIDLKRGVDRNTAVLNTQWIGCGKFASPSTIPLPAATTEHSLNIGGATAITILGTNYVSNLRFLEGQFRWKNNIPVDDNYVPGGGTQNGFNIMGRMRRGVPEAGFRMTVEVVDGSTEWAAFLAQSTGTVVLTIEGATIGAGPEKHKLSITLHQVQFRTHKWTSANGLIAADIECDVQLHSTNGILTYEAVTTQNDIGTAAS
jgi:hypothetical protein